MPVDISSQKIEQAISEITEYLDEQQKNTIFKHHCDSPIADGREAVPRKEAESPHEEEPAPSEETEKKTETNHVVNRRFTTSKGHSPLHIEDPEEESKKEEKQSFLPSGPVPKYEKPANSIPHYAPPEAAKISIGKETLMTCVHTLNNFLERKQEFRPFLLVFVSDDGTRSLTRFYTFDEAESAMQKDIARYRKEVDPYDETKEIWYKEGDEDIIVHDPTPLDELNDDETFKSEAQMEGLEHIAIKGNHAVVFNAKVNRTARWDIFDIRTAYIAGKTELTPQPPKHATQAKPEETENKKEKKEKKKNPFSFLKKTRR